MSGTSGGEYLVRIRISQTIVIFSPSEKNSQPDFVNRFAVLKFTKVVANGFVKRSIRNSFGCL